TTDQTLKETAPRRLRRHRRLQWLHPRLLPRIERRLGGVLALADGRKLFDRRHPAIVIVRTVANRRRGRRLTTIDRGRCPAVLRAAVLLDDNAARGTPQLARPVGMCLALARGRALMRLVVVGVRVQILWIESATGLLIAGRRHGRCRRLRRSLRARGRRRLRRWCRLLSSGN